MSEPDFAIEKKLAIADCLYGDKNYYVFIFEKLIQCMKETNKLHGLSSEFFRLDFRQQDYYEEFNRVFPFGSLVLDLKWGSKKELEKKKNESTTV